MTLVLVAGSVLAVGACTDDDEATPSTSAPTPATSAAPPTISGAPATSSAPSSSTTPSTGAPPTTIAYDPGAVCTLGTNPDCIDPNETGEGVYLIGGADCIAAARQNSSSTAICADLDRDGRAGYPDRG